jgi:hypothetical protein
VKDEQVEEQKEQIKEEEKKQEEKEESSDKKEESLETQSEDFDFNLDDPVDESIEKMILKQIMEETIRSKKDLWNMVQDKLKGRKIDTKAKQIQEVFEKLQKNKKIRFDTKTKPVGWKLTK